MATVRNCINDASTGLDIKDDADNTKVLTYDVSGITTATTRTWTVDDRNINFDAVATSVGTDSGTCTPASGTFSIEGSGGVTTSASSDTITVTSTGGSGGVINWIDDQTYPFTGVVNTGYIAASGGGSASPLLPSTSSVGDILRLVAYTAHSGVTVTQNAGQKIITIANGTSTTGTGGSVSYSSTSGKSMPLELVCVVANTTWAQLSGRTDLTVV